MVLVPDLFSRLAQPQQVAQFHAGLMQLRLAVADGTAHHLGDLVVLVPFDVVQHEDDAIPGGRLSMARSRFTRSMEPASMLSRAPMSRLGPSSCCGSNCSSSETSFSPFLRRCISTTFTASRCSHVENADSPRKVAILR